MHFLMSVHVLESYFHRINIYKYKLNSKSAQFPMIPNKIAIQQLMSSNSDFQTSVVQTHQEMPEVSNDDMISIQEIQDHHASNPKHTMESLCRSFKQKYSDTPLIFQPATLAIELNAKLRRVYDMINILQGGGIIEKVEKGSYKWKHDSLAFSNEIQTVRNDWCSLRSISSQLKRVFFSIDQGLTCHILYNMLTSGKNNKFNPSTIRRRIYECCKVFTTVGLTQKVGKFFYNGRLKQKDIQHLIRLKMEEDPNKFQFGQKSYKSYENTQKSFHMNANFQEQANSKTNLSQKMIDLQFQRKFISNLAKKLRNQQDLNRFIKKLSFEFYSQGWLFYESRQLLKHQPGKESLTQLFETDVKIEEQKIIQETQFACQVHKNIIVSSSPKNAYTFSVSKNSSFCSFPSNSSFVINNMNAVQNLRGV